MEITLSSFKFQADDKDINSGGGGNDGDVIIVMMLMLWMARRRKRKASKKKKSSMKTRISVLILFTFISHLYSAACKSGDILYLWASRQAYSH